MLVLTFAPFVLTFAPCALAFALCACGIILLSTSASTPLAHMVVVTGCNLRWWRCSFSHWRKHSLHWRWCHPLQLALVVFFLPSTGSHTLLALGLLHMYIRIHFANSNISTLHHSFSIYPPHRSSSLPHHCQIEHCAQEET